MAKYSSPAFDIVGAAVAEQVQRGALSTFSKRALPATTAALDAASVAFLEEFKFFFDDLDRIYNEVCTTLDVDTLADVTGIPATSVELLGYIIASETTNYGTLQYYLTEITAAKAARFGRKQCGAATRITAAKAKVNDLKRVVFGVRSLTKAAMKVGGTVIKPKVIPSGVKLPDVFSVAPMYVKRQWETWTIHKLVTMFREGDLTVPPIQRGFVKAAAGARGWVKTAGAENLLKDMLNPSISKGSLLVVRNPDGSYEILDGQQRITVAYLFWNDELVVPIEDGTDTVKAKFSMLSDADQQLFLNETFNVEVISPTDLGVSDISTFVRIQVESFLACNDTAIQLTEDEKNAARLTPLGRSYIKAIATDKDVIDVLGPYIKDDRKALTAFIIRLFVMAAYRDQMSCDLGKIVWKLSHLTDADWEERAPTMIAAIVAARAVGGLRGSHGKFSAPLAETVIVVLYEIVQRHLVSWNDIQQQIIPVQQAISQALTSEEFLKYIHVGTNNPSSIQKEVEGGQVVGRYPYLIDTLGKIFTFSYADFRP